MLTYKQYLAEAKTKIIAYHGSKDVIDDFKYEYTNQGNDQLGSGFYFTTDIHEAKGYGKNVHKVELVFKKTLDADKIGNVTYAQIQKFIWKSPIKEDALSNWGDVEYEGRTKVLDRAISEYVVKKENIVRGLFNLANDFYPNHIQEFNERIFGILGYDSIVKRHETSTHYVAFFPSQIKILEVN